MVRLVAEVAGLHADHAIAKRYLMDGLKEMIGADCWAWSLGYFHPEKAPVYVSVLHGGFSEERFVRLIQATGHPEMKKLMAPFSSELMTRKCHLTRLRQEMDAESGVPFATSEVYPLWLAADIVPLILSARPLTEQCLSVIALYRRADQPLFTDRERRIAHIILTEVSWLHAIGWPEDLGAKTPNLSRRCRIVLNLLLEGHSRKYIAAELGISIHTVSGYAKEIYAVFGVQSHAELMHRFTKGGSPER